MRHPGQCNRGKKTWPLTSPSLSSCYRVGVIAKYDMFTRRIPHVWFGVVRPHCHLLSVTEFILICWYIQDQVCVRGDQAWEATTWHSPIRSAKQTTLKLLAHTKVRSQVDYLFVLDTSICTERGSSYLGILSKANSLKDICATRISQPGSEICESRVVLLMPRLFHTSHDFTNTYAQYQVSSLLVLQDLQSTYQFAL